LKPTRIEIVRTPDDPVLNVGDTMPIKEGVNGIVVARYLRNENKEVVYIVEPTDANIAQQ
jgi:hypothetical protein